MRLARIKNVIAVVLICAAMVPAGLRAQTILGLEPEAMQAVRNGDYVTLRNELVKGANPNMADDDGLTLMMIAARAAFLDILDLLVRNNAHLSATDRDGNTALHWAVIERRYGSIETLVSLGANVNFQNRRGETPLMVAAREGDRDIIDLLLQAEPDFTIRDYSGRGVLDYARNNRNSRVADRLREAGATD